MKAIKVDYLKRWKNKVILGDCLGLMRELPDNSIDLVCVDPPYPNMQGGRIIKSLGGVTSRIHNTVTVGSLWGDDIEKELFEMSRIARLGIMVFCSYHYLDKIPSIINETKVALITWYKRNSIPGLPTSPHYQTEFIWCFRKRKGLNWGKLKTMYDISTISSGCVSTGERIKQNGSGKALHPTQKPLSLMRELLKVGGSTIIDPMCGLGTTLVAAKQLGYSYIGFEIEPDYVKIAKRRLANTGTASKLDRLDAGLPLTFEDLTGVQNG